MRRSLPFVLSMALMSAGAMTACSPVTAVAAEEAFNAPAAEVKASETGKKVAIFAGGCFWGIEGVFSHVKGVSSVTSGYHGGSKADADYSSVSSGGTAHAEAVRVVYDPSVVRYDQLLQIFFSVGLDPTQVNRQGPDHGTQYRSALVPLSKEQGKVAAAYLTQLNRSGIWSKPIATKIEPYKAFYSAEDYHQDFMLKNPRHRYILAWDAAKVENLKKMFPGLYRATFVKG
jgi:peptide-methionine (S)-S-oxide reductase